MAQNQDTAKNQGLGYPLHVRATKLLGDFIKGAEDHFQYLQEILAEAKEHFERRESIELLPKTPCMKRKRKRSAKSPQCSPILASSPLQAQPSIEDVCKTPDSKKTATCKETPTKASDIHLHVDSGLNTSPDVSTTRQSNRALVSKAKKPSRVAQKKQPRRNTKKASALDKVKIIEEDSNKTATPKRVTRSKRKQAEKDTEAPIENENIKKKNKVPEAVGVEGKNMNDIKIPTPKRTTRSKRKESEQDIVDPLENLIKSEDCQLYTPSPQAKKPKDNQACIDNTPQGVEVFIPETPQIQQKPNEATPTQNKDVKAVRTSIKFVMTPKSDKTEDENEVNVYAEEQNRPSTDVVIVEARIYENENIAMTTSTPEKATKEEPISEPTVTSTKKLRRETRSSVITGTKRKQDNEKPQDKKPKMSSPVSLEVPAQEGVNTQQNCASDQAPNSDSDDAVVSSTVSIPPTKPRRSFRPSRGTRRSSRLSIQANKNKVRKSKSLVKSSVTLKLSTKLMPSLERSSEEEENHESSSEFAKENVTKQLLFKESNINNRDADSAPESSPVEEDSHKRVEEEDVEVETKQDPTAAMPNTTSKEPVNVTDNAVNNKDDASADDNKDDTVEEVFHDAADSNDDEEFHDASEKTDDAKGSDDDNDAADSGPITRSSSRNQSSDSSSSSGRGSTSSRETELLSPCRETGDECNRSQSSPEPSQENCVPVEDGASGDMIEEQDQHLFGFENKVLINHAGVVESFIKRNTPKKVNRQEKSRIMKLAIQEKDEKEKERLERLAMQKQKRIEDQKRRREEKERKVAGIRADKIREQKEKKEQLEKKLEMRRRLEEKAKKIREKEEESKRRARNDKIAECEARRKQEEEQKKQKRLEKEEEERKHQEMMQRKAEFEEQERHRKILEAKRQQEYREAELQREKQRMKKEIEEKERKAKEERENQEKKQKEDREKQEKKQREEKEREERERKRIAALLKEKEEQDRKERERKATEVKLRQEREYKFRIQEEAEREKERLRKLQEQREIEEARIRALRDIDCYDMTPPPPPRIRSVATNENYNIDDIGSDDSTDDEDAPKKKIPQWAQGAKLKAALMNQSAMTIDEIETIFGGIVMPNLDEIFTKKKRKRFYQRTSSAHWESPPLKPLNRGTLI